MKSGTFNKEKFEQADFDESNSDVEMEIEERVNKPKRGTSAN